MDDYKFDLKIKDKTYELYFNLNVMKEIQQEYGLIKKWGELTDATKGEVDIGALIFGFTAMINEGIEIHNEKTGEKQLPLTVKQVGRLITEIGLDEASETISAAVIEATKSNEKN